MDRFVVIDAFAILHRAYHALPPLTNKEGQLTNAVYGFTSILLKVINGFKPKYIAIAFDTPEPTFRHKLYDKYQAERPEMDKELSSQIDLVRKVIKAMGVPIIEKPGYEADDVIGTIVERIKNQESRIKNNRKKEIIVVTGDRDLLQLVNKNVKAYLPVKGLSESKLYDEEEVRKKFGITSGQIVDYKALIGDSSDGYPGVKGIGPKSAVKLLEKYGTLQGIYKHLSQISNLKLREVLSQGKDDAQLSYKLAKIVTDVPVDIDLAACQMRDLSNPQVIEVFQGLGFKSLLTRIMFGNNQSINQLHKQEKKQIADDEQMTIL